MHPPSAPADRRADRIVAVLLAIGVLVAYTATTQGRLWGDGPEMLRLLEWEGRPWWRTWAHPLHTPLAAAFAKVAPLERAHDAFVLASSVPAALGTGACYLIARTLGAGRVAGAAGALLVAASPVLWYFATVLEVHATHAGVVAVCALASLALAPRLGPRAFVAVHALLFGVVSLSHLTAATLVPLWALLGSFASRAFASGRTSGAAPRVVSRATLVHGAAAIGAYALAYGIAQLTHHRFAAADPRGGSIADLVLDSIEPFSIGYFVDDWIEPLSWSLVPFGLFALLWALPRTRRALEPDARAFGAVALVGGFFPFAFYAAWSLPNDGGYAAGLLPFVAVTAALFRPGARDAARRWCSAS